jgi:hypothetical protein
MMDSDGELLGRLRSGDERAFVGLVERYHEPMLRLAASFVPSRARTPGWRRCAAWPGSRAVRR